MRTCNLAEVQEPDCILDPDRAPAANRNPTRLKSASKRKTIGKTRVKINSQRKKKRVNFIL